MSKYSKIIKHEVIFTVLEVENLWILFEGASFQKQGFYAHSGMAKFSLFGVSLKAKYLKKSLH